MNFNKNWQFHLMDIPGAEATDFDAKGWRTLDLPHDWSVEHGFSQSLEGCTGYLPGGIGWYRKTFKTSVDMLGRLVFINFDGIYNHSDIYVNGMHVAYHPNGYTPIEIEIGSRLNPPDEDNVIAVRVDHSRYADSRWYTGSGIYRNVTMTVVDACHIPATGFYLTTSDITEKKATVSLEVKVRNGLDRDQEGRLTVRIFDPRGLEVKTCSRPVKVEAGSVQNVSVVLKLDDPELWHMDSPNLYEADITLVTAEANQELSLTFGIRSIEFDPYKGFFLNGRNEKIKGVCLHHDGGLVGAAVPKDVWRRRLALLKDGGCNAIRTAHNPPSSEFLDLCDEMGFLVQDEFFDEWDYGKDKRLNNYDRHGDYISEGYCNWFQDWAERDLHSTMMRDRNHPCIVQWSIGNEIEWVYRPTVASTGYFDADTSGNYFWTKPPYKPAEIQKRYEALDKGEYQMGATAQKLSAWTKERDTTRPVILNAILPSADYGNGVAEGLDIIGYSYRRVMYDYCHEHFPDLPIMGTENLGQWHEWKAVEERDFISGMYIWTGVDYMGESNGQWPVNTTGSGLIDRAGFKKPSWHMFRSLWSDRPHIHMTTKCLKDSIYELNVEGKIIDTSNGGWKQRLWLWHEVDNHWNYEACDQVVAEVLSNCESVELYLNGQSLGRQKLSETPDRIFKWVVPYRDGELKAIGRSGGREVDYSIRTAGVPEKLVLTKETQPEESGEVVHVVAQLIDSEGQPVKHMNETLKMTVEGGWKIMGVDNGSKSNTQPYQSDLIHTDQGRALVILKKSGEEPGRLRVWFDRYAVGARLSL